MSETKKPLPTDECECEHERDEHEDGAGICEARTSSGMWCSCPSFKAAGR